MSGPFDANAFPLDPGIHLLEASAGTGKTFALAHLVLRYLAEAQLSLRQVLVVTFTEAAAAELRDRIGRRLQQALAGLDGAPPPPGDPVLAAWLEAQRPRSGSLRARLLLALEELDAADITTIHGFCRRSLQRQALEAAQPPALEIDSDAGLLVEQISHDYWLEQVLPLEPALVAGLQRAGLGPQVLAELLLRLDGDPALELDPSPLNPERSLVEQLPQHWQACWEQLQRLWRQSGQALEAELRAIAGQWRGQGVRKSDPYSPRPRRDRAAEVDSWIASQPQPGSYDVLMAREGAADLLHTYFHPGSFLKVARPLEAGGEREPSLPQRPLLEAIAAAVDGVAEAVLLHACHWGRSALRRRRQRSGRLGFAQLLEGLDPGEAAQTPQLAAVAARYAVALIDEFQDTDPIQWRILSRAFRSPQHRLVMVGDPKQAIYRFRGGELATYLAARQAAAAAGGVSALADNYRSSAPLIAALNALMAPGLRRSGLAVPAVRARAAVPPLAGDGPGGQAPPISLLWLGGERPAGGKPPSRTSLEQQLPGQIASATAALLNDHRANGLTPADVCLLVSTHAQAEALRAALARCGIASRLVSQGDVFESAGATTLQRLLDALAQPGQARRLRLLAASPLLGWSAAEIAAAGPERWSALAGRLAALAAELPRRGLLGVLGSLLQDRGVARLSLEGRLLADLQQCAELVQERLHSDQLDAASAADWLRRLRLDPDRRVPDSHLPNSDVADAAVSVVTVHRSKGLEYPVVICPYLWQGPATGGSTRVGVRWQPPGSTAPRLDLHRNPHWGAGHAARRQQLAAELAERERLAYVAVTRAQRLLVLAWGPAAGQQGNPLHGWLFSAEALPDPHLDATSGRSDADWRQALAAEIARRNLALAVVDPPAPDGRIMLRPSDPAATATLQNGPIPQRRFDRIWGRSSYSSWTHGSQGSTPAALEEGRETDGPTREPELAPPAAGGPGAPALERDGPLASFPRGSQAGDCLHRILEQLDYQQPLAQQGELCTAELSRAGIDADHRPALLAGLERLRLQPLAGPLAGLRFADLASTGRLHEMNFDLPLASVRAADLAAAFRDHPAGAFGAAYAHELAALPIASRGFLTGSIDLVFRHGERWWVVDWKSNWLGERDGEGRPLHCGPRHYGQASMAALMAANHYPLQAHLYLVALHRYLAWRLPGYRPEAHLGGYLYVFLRGLPDPAAAPAAESDPPGLFLEQPPLQRLLALDRTLAGTAGGALPATAPSGDAP